MDFDEDFREQLSSKISGTSAIANWERVARVLKVDVSAIKGISEKGTSHRLLFRQIRYGFPELTLSYIKNILENKINNKRKDIFYDYQRKEGLPSLDVEIGSLDEADFELVLENVADKLMFDKAKGYWRHLGGKLDFTPDALDSIESDGKPDSNKNAARTFIDYIGHQRMTVQALVNALESDRVRRNDVKDFLCEHLKMDDCWIESCADIEARSKHVLGETS